MELNRQKLIEDFKSYKKLDYLELSVEEFGMKDYFLELNLELSCIKFRSRASTVSTCSTHYPSNPEYMKNMFQCYEKNCTELDTILHWETSDCYTHLKSSGSIKNDQA